MFEYTYGEKLSDEKLSNYMCDNKFVSVVESIGLILVIILFFTVIGVAGSKIIKF